MEKKKLEVGAMYVGPGAKKERSLEAFALLSYSAESDESRGIDDSGDPGFSDEDLRSFCIKATVSCLASV